MPRSAAMSSRSRASGSVPVPVAQSGLLRSRERCCGGPPEDRLFLARFDTDLYSRWQALNGLLTQALIAATAPCGGQQPVFDPALAQIMGETAGDDRLEAAYRALALTLPSEADIARENRPGHRPRTPSSRRARLSLPSSTPTAPTSSAASGRSSRLRRRSAPTRTAPAAWAGQRPPGLSLDTGDASAAAHHYRDATNMTDRAAALAVLVHRFADPPKPLKRLAISTSASVPMASSWTSGSPCRLQRRALQRSTA